MDTSSIDLTGSEIETIRMEGEALILRFSRFYITKTMTGSDEQTRWWQAGELAFTHAELEGELPDTPCICDGGDVGESVYTYRDMLPLPLESQGCAHCALKIRGSEQLLTVRADGVKLVMEDRPQYIEHIRPG